MEHSAEYSQELASSFLQIRCSFQPELCQFQAWTPASAALRIVPITAAASWPATPSAV